jgi:hypothetical protein
MWHYCLMHRYLLMLIAFFSFFVCLQVRAADEFDAVRCGADIPKAMVGKHSSDGPVVVSEARHPNLSLKDLGGIEISNRLFLISWRICDREYAELLNTKKDLVRDVLPVPKHSLYSPLSFAEPCQVDGKNIPDAVISILDNPGGQRPKGYFESIMLPVKVAWKIDERKERFVPMPRRGLTCALGGDNMDLEQGNAPPTPHTQ